ncbi:MAG: GNAT family N-acetyltransferase [Planctomycetaceae bacterium]
MPRLRTAADSDSPGVIALIARVYAEYPGCVLDVEREERGLLAPASSFDRFWVAEEAGQVVGCAACSIASERVEVKKVYLDRAYRGRGLGRRLIALVEEAAATAGVELLELWSDTRFLTAHAVYERLGYVRSGRTRELHDLSRSVEFHFTKRLPFAAPASKPPAARPGETGTSA